MIFDRYATTIQTAMFVLFILYSFLFPAAQTQQNRQEIPIYTFEEFSPYLNKDSDTTYIINFWASWCKPCIKELPDFDQLEKHYEGKKVKVILVSLDFGEKLESQVLPLLQKRNIQSQVVVLDDPDANSWINKIDPGWSGSIPATLVYRKKERYFFERSFTASELHETLDPIINHTP